MKKKLALLLAATMIIGMMPFSAFAVTGNRVTNVVSIGSEAKVEIKDAPQLVIKNDKDDITGNTKFSLTLNGSKWQNVGSFESDMEAAIIKYSVGLNSSSSTGVADAASTATAADKAVADAQAALKEAKYAVVDATDVLATLESNKGAVTKAIMDTAVEGIAATTAKVDAAKAAVDAANDAAKAAATAAKDLKNKDEADDAAAAVADLKAEMKKFGDASKAVSHAVEDLATKVADELDPATSVDLGTVATAEYKALTDAAGEVAYTNGANLTIANSDAAKAATKANADKADEELGKIVGDVNVVKVSDNMITVEVKGVNDGSEIKVPMFTEMTSTGEVTVSVDSLGGLVSPGTYTFANTSGGATKSTIAKSTDISELAKTIESIVITETTANSIKAGTTVKLKLSNGFEFDKTADVTVSDLVNGTVSFDKPKFPGDTNDTIEFTMPSAERAKAGKIVINGIKVKVDDAKAGDIAEITVSGNGVVKETLEVAKYVDFDTTFAAQDKDLPIIYSGTPKTGAEADNATLEATLKETVANTWNTGRKVTISLPEGVKFATSTVDYSQKNSELDGVITVDVKDESKATFTIKAQNASATSKKEITFKPEVSVAPDFVGDIELTVSGSGIGDDMKVVVGKAVAPVTITAKTNDVMIDYRNVAVSDMVITESYAGALEKGTTLYISAEEMQFEGGMKYEVTEGDLKVESLKVDKGVIALKIKSESSKTPAKITLSNAQLFLNRSLPAGEYKLNIVANGTKDTNAYFKNYIKDTTSTAFENGFDIDTVTAMDNYIKVITSGRDQEGFTTKITVQVGANELLAGDKVIPLATPAYISAEGYTMLPVRAVTEALSGTAIVNWDNATRKVTIISGTRVISMTIGSSVMVINGTEVPMSSKAVITDEYTFIPLRDLGYALGLSDDKIKWDDATKTATLN